MMQLGSQVCYNFVHLGALLQGYQSLSFQLELEVKSFVCKSKKGSSLKSSIQWEL